MREEGPTDVSAGSHVRPKRARYATEMSTRESDLFQTHRKLEIAPQLPPFQHRSRRPTFPDPPGSREFSYLSVRVTLFIREIRFRGSRVLGKNSRALSRLKSTARRVASSGFAPVFHAPRRICSSVLCPDAFPCLRIAAFLVKRPPLSSAALDTTSRNPVRSGL